MPERTHLKIGIDEAGRWPWAGPVVACALAFNTANMPSESFLARLSDSKALSSQERESLFSQMIMMANAPSPQLFFGVGVVDNFLIDSINIRQATREAMRRAIVELMRKIPVQNITTIAIDGRDNFRFDELPKAPIYIVGWDAKVIEISAASIIAKVFRDDLMRTYSRLYPALHLSQHKGYGTASHSDALQSASDISGIHRLSYAPIQKVLHAKPKCLLHVCCGPDATVPILDLKEKYDLTCFWYDPNIQPKEEYDKRYQAFVKVCEIEGVPYLEGEYDVKRFFSLIKGLEHTPEKGEKCTVCYDMRLERSAQKAQELGISLFTSTLNTSPHKDLTKMFALGDKYAAAYSLEFLKIPFRKNGGFDRSVAYTIEHDIYRQDYCGCVYSDTFPWRVDAAKKRAKGWSG